MAEIKSTMEMVLERAARMSAEAGDSTAAGNSDRDGMKLAAAYLNDQEKGLMEILKEQPPQQQMAIRSGMIRTLLRNIVLPREETVSESSLLALKGIQELSGNSADINSVCMELSQILEQYNQHKEQARQQLDEAIRGQLKQKLFEQGQNIDDEMSLNPAMHPQYREELTRMTADLNDQYNNALDQRKEVIRQRLAG